MTGTGGGAGGDGAGAGAADALCVLDAVVCVHFAGANLVPVLTTALASAGFTLLVPQEVCDEVRRKDAKYPGLAKRWAALERSRQVQVLPRLELATAPARVIDVLEEIRDLDFEQALLDSRDLGEHVVIAQGVHLKEQGRAVALLIDDGGGQRAARRWDMDILTMEDVLMLALYAGRFAALDDLRGAYRRLREYGDGLPDFQQTALPAAFRAWVADGP
ncbi:hypothetical protein ACIQGZ_27015 [Streptomyces sp. NPDC092296]|uniref:hypothetical protein n=1 Tax=Streptomyces sp. NPDC092296 TaxID=3366012 RepID=UPI003820AC33